MRCTVGSAFVVVAALPLACGPLIGLDEDYYVDSGVGGASGCCYRAAVLADAPVGYWRLGESGGTTANDATTYGHDGTYYGYPTFGAQAAIACESDTAVRFNGMDDRLDLGSGFSFSGVQAFSLEMWMNPEVADYNGVIAKNGNYAMYLETGGGGLGFVRGDAHIEMMPPPPLNAYSHIVAMFDGNSLAIYVNGMPMPVADGVDQAPDGGVPPLADTTETVTVGHMPMQQAGWFKGLLDEVAVYDHALSVERIAAHYHCARRQ